MRQSKVIGVTGGVGAGKSTLLAYVKENKGCSVILADDVGRRLSEKGKCVYRALLASYGEEILDAEGNIDRKRLYEKAFTGEAADVSRLNRLTHPLIRREIRRMITVDPSPLIFLEAALLYEGKLDTLCTDVWYVASPAELRKRRLYDSRGYSEERSDSIMKNQLRDEEFRGYCPYVIENDGSLADLYAKIDRRLREIGAEYAD